jgi:predicted TIM-barrel fold metal-dependent hydrolase
VITDIHAHYHPQVMLDALAAMPGRGARGRSTSVRMPWSDGPGQVAARLEMMDAAGVAVQVLSPAAGFAPYSADAGAAITAARAANDGNAELIAAHPRRFRGLASLPLPHIDAALTELGRAMDELGMVGVNIHCSVLDRPVVDEAMLPLYAELDRRRALVLFHPAGNGICSPMITDFGLQAAVGTSLEDTTVALHLIARRIPDRFPNITFVIPHLGGPIAMLLQRLDRQFSMDTFTLAEPPSVTARRFYYDTVGHGSQAALWCAYKAFGADHLVAGSDFPVLVAWESYARTFDWIREAGLPEDDVAQILHANAPTLLDRTLTDRR